MTRVRGTEPGTLLHSSVLGYDANSLYAGMLMGSLPTGLPTTWSLDQGFFHRGPSLLKKTNSSYEEMEYCFWRESTTSSKCLHTFNGGQVFIGSERKFKPDLYFPEERRVELYNGCFIHNHPDPSCPHSSNKEELKLDQEAYKYYEDHGLSVTVVWSCQWAEKKRQDPSIEEMLDKYLHLPFRHKDKIHEKTMLEKILDGTIYGLVEYTAHITDEYKDHYMYNLSPFFQTVEISPSDLSEEQQEVLKQQNAK